MASLDLRDIDVRLTPAAGDNNSCSRDLSPTRSLCIPVYGRGVGGEEREGGDVGGRRDEVPTKTRKRSREDLDTQSVDLHYSVSYVRTYTLGSYILYAN